MKKYLFIILGLIFAQLSCSDFLNIEPRESISIQQQFSTLDGTKRALSGAYLETAALHSSVFYTYADVLGGNTRFTPAPQGSTAGTIVIPEVYRTFYSFNETELQTSFKSFYENSYAVINNANNIIFYSDNVPDASLSQKNQIKAEAFALRAFLHYNLLQLYSQTYNFSQNASHRGVVYADRILVGGVDFPARKTAAESYGLIVSDLQTALSLFQNEQALSGPKYSYFNAITTKAFLARVALQKRDFSLAITTATDIIGTAGVTLMTGANYNLEWEKPNSPPSEVLFEFTPRNAGDTPNLVSFTVATYYKFPFLVNDTYGRLACSTDLYNLFSPSDVRRNCFLTQTFNVRNGNQFTNVNFNFTKKHQNNAGAMVIRLSEMYLILAEANARQNNNGVALTNLNIIRERSNLTALPTSNNILDEIFLERRRELCFESVLLFDIARFNKSVVRGADCIATQCNLNFPNSRFILPIAQSFVNINQNMIQNEGY